MCPLSFCSEVANSDVSISLVRCHKPGALSRDLAFCHLCMAAKKTVKIGNTKVDGPTAPMFGGYLRP
ncbi:hypothetical protein DPMN_174113 [Dreissena polymorpha]|uniref:Uncharacterized protein n=1 Tax=Dreissena polymorpha TaxID=45954 RepID=A0A9D4E2U8_DREPO|nr:hypothetical protein DPMN_174113 [Dreissena polymorpha]